MDDTRHPELANTEDGVISGIAKLLASFQDSEVPKHVQLRMALVEGIKSGLLKPGDQIPPERRLSEAVNLSLGTVQRSLGKLAVEGIVVRRHGTGTFVAEQRKPSETVWQFRFFSRDGKGPLPVYPRFLSCDTQVDDSLLYKILGKDRHGYCRISRTYDVGDQFTCFGDFFVCNSRFENFADILRSEKGTVSFKVVLERDYAAPTISIAHWVRGAELPDDVCDHIGLPARSAGLVVEVIGFTHDRDPISFQRIFVPNTDYVLDMSHQVYSPELERPQGDTSLF